MKRFVLATLVVFTLPMASFAETGLSAKGLAKILTSKAAMKVLKDRSIDEVKVEPIAAMESSGFQISIASTEVGLSPAGPSTHPCMISITAARPKFDEKAPYTISAREICAMSAPMPAATH